MFEGKSIWQIIEMGGFTMYVLLACSVLVLGVVLERVRAYRAKTRDRVKFMDEVRNLVGGKRVDLALEYCAKERTPIAAVVGAGLRKHGAGERELETAMEREVAVETIELERYTSIVGTIGNVAVYVGLFGTVLGIVRSFHNISLVTSGGISVVIGGVSEALICTATGLLVAVPSVVTYNWFMRRIDRFVTDMEYCASETVDLLVTRKKA